MGVVRLERGSDLSTPGGRELLQESLELLANSYRSIREELDKVREQDRIVAPVPIEEFPTALGIFSSTQGGNPQGSILLTTVDNVPPGYRDLDGTGGAPEGRGRVPVFSGIGPGLTTRTVGATGGAETVAADLASHSHTMGNHVHDRGNHAHDLSHTHPGATNAHVHNTTFYTPGAGSTTGPSLTASGGTPTSAVNTSAPSAWNTGAASTSVTSTDGSGNTGGPSTNNTDSAGSGGGHNNMQPFLVLKAVQKTALGDLDLDRKAPILFGRVPGLLDFDGPSVITNASILDGYEVLEAGQHPEKIVELSLSGGGASGNSTAALKFGVYIPYNFRRWRTASVRLKSKIVMSGCPVASSAVITLRARKPTSTSSYLSGVHVRTLNRDGSGAIEDAAWVDMTLKTTDLGEDWLPGYFLSCEVLLSVPRTFTTCSIKFGRLQINW